MRQAAQAFCHSNKFSCCCLQNYVKFYLLFDSFRDLIKSGLRLDTFNPSNLDWL